MSEGPTEGLPENASDAAAVSKRGSLETLVGRLGSGALSSEDQRRLAGLLVAEPPELVMVATRHELYSGPSPNPDLLNRFDAATRHAMLQMAVDEQAHGHRMRGQRRLEGAIAKDRRGQPCGLVIAVAGLVAAVATAPFSARPASSVHSSCSVWWLCSWFPESWSECVPTVDLRRNRPSGFAGVCPFSREGRLSEPAASCGALVRLHGHGYAEACSFIAPDRSIGGWILRSRVV